jgi:phosphoglycerate dehydrogenase-like enzyme
MPRSPDHPTRKLLILTYHRLDLWIAPEWFVERLRKEFPQFEVVRLTTYDGIESELADAEVLVTQSLRPEQFRVARKLRWIHSPAAAVHQFLFPELVNSGVVLTNAREVHGPVVAEHVMALIFALAKRIPDDVRSQQKHLWAQEQLWLEGKCPRELAGATVGLVGLGSIGRGVAKSAAALGMNVIAVREHPDRPKPEFVSEVLPATELHEMLSRSDYVVLSPPLTPATRGMIGRDQFARMKADGFLINVGRGPLIDEVALYDALHQHQIGGAALDVFEKEPLPIDSQLWDLDNLLITPHTAGMTEKLWERHYLLLAENLRRYAAGEPLLAVVDKKLGY